MTRPLQYALVTPARDEEANLRRLAASLAQQTVPPTAWIVVDNGSIDGTVRVAQEFAAHHPWTNVLRIGGLPNAAPGAPVVRAFHAGLEALNGRPDVVVKLDADVSFDPDYFELLLGKFARDDRLGIASGVCYEQANGDWHPVAVTAGHVRGAVRAYRRQCLEQILPLEESMGWDGVDEMKANALGWSTRMIEELGFYHHRRLGERDGGVFKRWVAQGRGAHYMRYRPSYLVLRSLFRARREPAALAMLWGYIEAAVRNERRCSDELAVAELRRRQRLRRVSVPR